MVEESPSIPDTRANRFAYYTALAMSGITLITFVIGFFTPPVSGPFCPGDCLEYPFPGIESRFPRDYFWMYPAILMNICFVLFVAGIHACSPGGRKIYSLPALSFAVISAGIGITNYFLQISVIQASLLQGESEGIALLTQFNPHGLFIGMEEIGFIMMSLAMLFAAFSLSRTTGKERAVRWIFISGFILMVLSLLSISMVHGLHREYRFEVAVITINWTALIVGGILLGLAFRNRVRHSG